ncbi:MAG: hypothetical protein HOK52_11985 [Candidatus Marinimicrobia bacterium]|nr:hypothetical protein [Candidatus Neomarinimicrobiota bacterium]MBT3937508.1 hypothetical protein [Candidatus Neomarinimicrobiota bacterium]MBT3961160.1 hypothetical protein [Candidatus Neomarinimicrobiota bacterium]MBT4384043.1 hypothetical protein [Candidatus Neomarinimicrobiota bacterium]MBT4686219.1 hypothetical protein [Candidatus Neomarinimicrobiota bacterium]
MDNTRLAIYERLRDFFVPAPILDEIFSQEDDFAVLLQSWEELRELKYKEDEIADQISKTIFKELDIEPDYQDEDEK